LGEQATAKWDEDVARRSPHAARQPLIDAEIEAKRRELQQLARTSFAWRAFTYFTGCFACQAFWTAVEVYALTRGVGDFFAAVLSAASYSGAAVLIGAPALPGAPVRGESAQPCKGCQKG
jgi:hypothetical protein